MDRSSHYYQQVQLLLGLKDIDQLPAVRWKMQNLANMAPEKHAKAFEDLQRVLYDY